MPASHRLLGASAGQHRLPGCCSPAAS